jgi:hypothetical protein
LDEKGILVRLNSYCLRLKLLNPIQQSCLRKNSPSRIDAIVNEEDIRSSFSRPQLMIPATPPSKEAVGVSRIRATRCMHYATDSRTRSLVHTRLVASLARENDSLIVA